MTLSVEQRLQRLEDLEQIKHLKARYFRLLDLHWWDEFEQLFTDDVSFDITESSSGAKTKGEFIEALRAHLGTAMSVHHGHMPEIDLIDDTNATGIWAMYDLVEPAADRGYPVLTGAGHYNERYRKEDGGWRICALRLTRLRRVVDGEIVIGTDIDGRRPFGEQS